MNAITDQMAVGLYFPHVEFHDAGWLQAAALYWDQLFRIVPPLLRQTIEDSDDVRELKDQLDFVREVNPETDAARVAPRLAAWLRQDPQRAATLRVPSDLPASYKIIGADDIQASLTFVHVGKFAPKLRDYLFAERLGVRRGQWLGMLESLGAVYVTALAREIASGNAMHPLSSHPTHQLAVLEPTFDELAQDLLEGQPRVH